MKKIFTLLVVALLGLSVQAQTVTITKKDGSVVTFQAGEIRNIQFAPGAAKPDTTVMRELTGYLMVTSSFFPNTYYGDAAKMKVMMVENKQLVQFSDPMWGTGLFNITLAKGQISGSGKLAVPNMHGGGVKEYDATMSGKMTEIAISIPTLMGGTTITWHNGQPTPSVKIAGSYQGDDNINVGGMFPYTSAGKVTYKVEANADGTINLVVPEVKYNGTMMGDLTLGTYTIKNIPYDETQKAFVKAYKDDNIKFLFTVVKDGKTTQKEYTFDNPRCKVMVSKDDKGALVVHNTYQMGGMPMLINGTFKSSK